MSMVGQRRSLEIFICMPKLREPMLIRSTFLFSHWNRENKTDDPVIISSFTSLAFNSETKISSDSLFPTILILPHPTLVLKDHIQFLFLGKCKESGNIKFHSLKHIGKMQK